MSWLWKEFQVVHQHHYEKKHLGFFGSWSDILIFQTNDRFSCYCDSSVESLRLSAILVVNCGPNFLICIYQTVVRLTIYIYKIINVWIYFWCQRGFRFTTWQDKFYTWYWQVWMYFLAFCLKAKPWSCGEPKQSKVSSDMTFSWFCLAFFRTFLWISNDCLMTSLCFSHYFLISFSWLVHELLANFSWFFFYDFS